MFKKLFGGKSQEDKDEYVRRVAEINRIIQSDMDEDNKQRIINNLNKDLEEDYE